MPTPLIKPATMFEPFARIGTKNVIPVAASATIGRASYEVGFPGATMTPVQSGGVPPAGADFNGIFNHITQHLAWVNAGGQYTFDADLVTFTGGYKIGAVVQSNDGLSSYVNAVNNNTVNFNSTPAAIDVSWKRYAGKCVIDYIDQEIINFGATSVPQYVNANYTALKTGDLWTNTSAGSFTITLPDPPTNANILRIQDVAGTWSSRPLTINPGTKTINNDPGPMICDVDGEMIGMWYDGTTWRLV